MLSHAPERSLRRRGAPPARALRAPPRPAPPPAPAGDQRRQPRRRRPRQDADGRRARAAAAARRRAAGDPEPRLRPHRSPTTASSWCSDAGRHPRRSGACGRRAADAGAAAAGRAGPRRRAIATWPGGWPSTTSASRSICWTTGSSTCSSIATSTWCIVSRERSRAGARTLPSGRLREAARRAGRGRRRPGRRPGRRDCRTACELPLFRLARGSASRSTGDRRGRRRRAGHAGAGGGRASPTRSGSSTTLAAPAGRDRGRVLFRDHHALHAARRRADLRPGAREPAPRP